MIIYFRCSEKETPITFKHLKNKSEILKKSWLSLQQSVTNEDQLIVIHDYVSKETIKFLDDTAKTLRRFIKVPKHDFKNHTHTVIAIETLKKELSNSNESDWHFMCEDDYLFLPNALEIIRKAQKHWGGFIVPYDLPIWYKQGFMCQLVVGHFQHWRTCPSATMTLMARSKTWKKYIHILESIASKSDDSVFQQIFQSDPCIAPLPAVAAHLAQGQTSPIVNWDKIWDDIDITYKK
jgi:gas vesicle protein